MLKKLDILDDNGVVETTLETTFYEITSEVENIPKRYGKVFIVDQPGIGGLKVTLNDFLTRFGPGEFEVYFIS